MISLSKSRPADETRNKEAVVKTLTSQERAVRETVGGGRLVVKSIHKRAAGPARRLASGQ